jgi:hypothetical protein
MLVSSLSPVFRGVKYAFGYALIKRPHTLRRSRSVGSCLALSGFALKPENLLTVIERFPAFSALFTAASFRIKN